MTLRPVAFVSTSDDNVVAEVLYGIFCVGRLVVGAVGGVMLMATVLVVDVAPDSPVALYEILSGVQLDAVWV